MTENKKRTKILGSITKLCIAGGIAALLLAGCSNANKENARNWPTDDTVIRLYQHETDTVTEIPLGEYLCGVLAGEMDNTWPEEALKAQAILARTFTLEKMEQNAMAERNADASTDIHEFQAYDASKINEAIREAVDDTENEVAVYKGELIKAWFFSDGGGKTAASAKEGLSYDKEETPYIHSVKDPGAQHGDNPNGQWNAEFPMAE
ncbi:MAG: SpoIID/LytB domain-containing protein, partial [Peptococcaceae bacterium]|nr:SpoIID/LytB domain-containing protein [Peptococcaceae bacterium]